MASLSLTRSRQAPAEESPAFGGIAERFRRGGDLDRAIVLCREGLQKFPNQLSARVTLGWALLDKGDYDAAQAELEQVLRRAPDNLAAIRGLAELHERAEMAMPSMDGDTHWAPPSEPPVVVDLPPVPLPPHVSVEIDLSEPVDAEGNPLLMTSPSTQFEVDAFHAVQPEVREPQPAAFAMDVAEIVSTDTVPGAFDVGADGPIARSPALLSGNEPDDLTALNALAFDVGIDSPDSRALFSVTETGATEPDTSVAEPAPEFFQSALLDEEASLDPFFEAAAAAVDAEPADSLLLQSQPAFGASLAASTEAAFEMADADAANVEVADLLLDLPDTSADLALTHAFAALEASPIAELDDEPVVDLATAAEDTRTATEFGWPSLPSGQLEFVSPVRTDADAQMDAPAIAVAAHEAFADTEALAFAADLTLAAELEPSTTLLSVPAPDDAVTAVLASVEAVETSAALSDDVEFIERAFAATPAPEDIEEKSSAEAAVDLALIDGASRDEDAVLVDLAGIDLETDHPAADQTLPIAAFSGLVASAVADLIRMESPGLPAAAVEVGRSESVAGTPRMNGHAASRRSALPALERFLRQVEARRLQLAAGSPA